MRAPAYTFELKPAHMDWMIDAGYTYAVHTQSNHIDNRGRPYLGFSPMTTSHVEEWLRTNIPDQFNYYTNCSIILFRSKATAILFILRFKGLYDKDIWALNQVD
jgi:hypothetical protein